jgi:hypothetical protein
MIYIFKAVDGRNTFLHSTGNRLPDYKVSSQKATTLRDIDISGFGKQIFMQYARLPPNIFYLRI